MNQEIVIGVGPGTCSVVLCTMPESKHRFGEQYAKPETYYIFVLDGKGKPIINETMPVLESTDLHVARRQFHLRLALMIDHESRRSGVHKREVQISGDVDPHELSNILWLDAKNLCIEPCD